MGATTFHRTVQIVSASLTHEDKAPDERDRIINFPPVTWVIRYFSKSNFSRCREPICKRNLTNKQTRIILDEEKKFMTHRVLQLIGLLILESTDVLTKMEGGIEADDGTWTTKKKKKNGGRQFIGLDGRQESRPFYFLKFVPLPRILGARCHVCSDRIADE